MQRMRKRYSPSTRVGVCYADSNWPVWLPSPRPARGGLCTREARAASVCSLPPRGGGPALWDGNCGMALQGWGNPASAYDRQALPCRRRRCGGCSRGGTPWWARITDAPPRRWHTHNSRLPRPQPRQLRFGKRAPFARLRCVAALAVYFFLRLVCPCESYMQVGPVFWSSGRQRRFPNFGN